MVSSGIWPFTCTNIRFANCLSIMETQIAFGLSSLRHERDDRENEQRADWETINNHMLGAIIPNEKEPVYNLRRCHLPKIKTERFKKTFVNRLIFKYNLV